MLTKLYNKTKILLVVLSVVILILATLITIHAYNIKTARFIIQLTAIPQVPVGTQKFILTYSGLQIYQSGNGRPTDLIQINSSGSINLLNLTNTSDTIGIATVPQSDSFDYLNLNIKSIALEINNTIYNVGLSKPNLTFQIQNGAALHGAGMLVNLIAQIVEVYPGGVGGQGYYKFFLVPSQQAILLDNNTMLNISHIEVGNTVNLNVIKQHSFGIATSNISILNTNLSTSNYNTTSIRIKVSNNGPTQVVLRYVAINGYLLYQLVPLSALGSIINSSNNATVIENITNKTRIESFLQNKLNRSIIEDLGLLNSTISVGAQTKIFEAESYSSNYYNRLNLIVAPNATLYLPFASNDVEILGYTLPPYTNVTLSFNGYISVVSSIPRLVSLISNQKYNVSVFSSNGAVVSANVTAT